MSHNRAHHITPRSVRREIEDRLSGNDEETTSKAAAVIHDAGGNFDISETIRELEGEMLKAAENLEFEDAAQLRDQIEELRQQMSGVEQRLRR